MDNLERETDERDLDLFFVFTRKKIEAERETDEQTEQDLSF